MNLSELILIVPEKADPERDSVADVWQSYGGEVLRLGRFWDPPKLESRKVRVYGNDSFCLVLAQKLGLELLSPNDDLLVNIPINYLKREVMAMPLGEVKKREFPQFIKSAVPKIFRAKIYKNVTELDVECTNLDDSTLTLVSEIVEVESEARCFVLGGCILDCSIYEGEHSTTSAFEFANDVIKELDLPFTCVMDIGFFKGLGWGIIEFNASWGAGLNGCNAKLVFPAIEAATRTMHT